MCQLVKVARRKEAKLASRRWPVATPASGSTDPHVRGIALFPEPGDFTASPAPCQGRSPGTEVPIPEARISPARSACRRVKRTLRYLSGTQRVSHIDTTMSSAGAVASPLRVAAVRCHAGNPTNVPLDTHYVKYIRWPVSRAHAACRRRLPPDSRADCLALREVANSTALGVYVQACSSVCSLAPGFRHTGH